MVHFVITGHGNFATGLQSMLKLVLGENELLHFVDFTEDLSSAQLKEKFEVLYTQYNGELVFLADIAGGTPFNEASMLMHQKGHKNNVMGGINIPSILAALDSSEETQDPLAILTNAHKAGIENMKIFGVTESNSSSDSDDDGI